MDKNTVRNNSISLIRIIAAFQVMLGHMIEHLELPGNPILFHYLYFFRGVPIFFAISGFLIWFSIIRSPDYKTYLKKRFLRIYPELWISILVEIVIMVLVYDNRSIRDYCLLVISQGSIFQFFTPNGFRSYGVGAPNGALWTIGIIVQFYIVAWFFYKYMRNKDVKTWLFVFVLIIMSAFIAEYIVDNVFSSVLLQKLYDQMIFKYFWIFYTGMFCGRFINRVIPVISKYWYVLLCLAALFFLTGFDVILGYYILWSVFLVLGLIGFSYRYPQFMIPIDLSYGVFLYHMIIVNLFVHSDLIGKWKYALLISCITLVIAYFSTVISTKMTKLLNHYNN